MRNNSNILFSSLFWKVLIFFLALDLGSKALMHRFFNYVVCFDGEYCNLKSVFITSLIDGQLYLSHVKHSYYAMTDRFSDGNLLGFIFKGLVFLLNKIGLNYDLDFLSILFPLLFILMLGLLNSNNKIKSSLSVFYIGCGMVMAGGLGNTIELYYFGWATDFIGITKNSFIYKLPLIGGKVGIANLADFSLWIGQIFFVWGLFLIKSKKSN